MDWLPDLPNTITKGLALLNGLLILTSYISFIYQVLLNYDIAFPSVYFRRTVVSIPCGPSALAVKEAAWGLARYAAISQVLTWILSPSSHSLDLILCSHKWCSKLVLLCSNLG